MFPVCRYVSFSGCGFCAKSTFSLFSESFIVNVALYRIYKIRKALLEYFLKEKSYFVFLHHMALCVTRLGIGQVIFSTPYDSFVKNGN